MHHPPAGKKKIGPLRGDIVAQVQPTLIVSPLSAAWYSGPPWISNDGEAEEISNSDQSCHQRMWVIICDMMIGWATGKECKLQRTLTKVIITKLGQYQF